MDGWARSIGDQLPEPSVPEPGGKEGDCHVQPGQGEGGAHQLVKGHPRRSQERNLAKAKVLAYSFFFIFNLHVTYVATKFTALLSRSNILKFVVRFN